METGASASIPGLAPALFVVFLLACSLALGWLFSEPQPGARQGRGREREAELPPPASSRQRRRGAVLQARRGGGWSRRRVRLLLYHGSMAIAVGSLALIFGTLLALIVRRMLGG